jgi:hypothetical protein
LYQATGDWDYDPGPARGVAQFFVY